MAFSDNLKTLASVQHIARLDLMDSTGINAGSIENKPGQQGSLASTIICSSSMVRSTPALRPKA